MKSAIRKLAIMLLMATIAIGAFATLGEGNSRKVKSNKSILSGKSQSIPGTFSLRSGYNFRGNEVIGLKQSTFINLNTVITYQQGNTTYSLPLKKKVILKNKVTFNPNVATR